MPKRHLYWKPLTCSRIYAELASSRGHGSLITAWQLLNRLPSSPFLKIRANRELPLISDVEEQYAKRIALTALQSEEPVGIDLLEEMAK
ncbi:hypothetical protein BLL04_20325 [Klebsiella variicola]|nr:hypothetical protein BLL04_20325 [Klebsiella variicola]